MAKLTAIEMGDALTKEFGQGANNLMPTNLYGPNDNFSDTESQAFYLISRMLKLKSKLNEFTVWGTKVH